MGTGLLLDRIVGEPPNSVHPVAWFGTVMQRVEHRLWPPGDHAPPSDSHPRWRGAAYAAAGVTLGIAAGCTVRSTTLAVCVGAAGRELRRVADQIGAAAVTGGLDAARAELPSLVGRDPSQLDASGVAAAVIESVAENSVDAVVAPVFWALLAGAPGACAYRAINTMDAMVGHRSTRYARFGTVAARLDDVANYAPARCFAVLLAMVTPTRARSLHRIIRRDAAAHPSPNAGVAESAMAAALDRQLGGPLRYGDRLEERPLLGDGDRPVPADIFDATRLAGHVELVMTTALLVIGVTRALHGRS
ncbi:MAG: adenosylcobinamide-phosphate synthase CbiB [Acidimicrobiales bacterium]